jgi:FAD/FMN-containing dehydrogenase
MSGRVYRPGEEGYERGRCGVNLALAHHPALVVQATGAADVVAAVRLAAGEGRAVAVMHTGHGPTVPADGAVMIHTRRMGRVSVDPSRRTAWIGAGAPWRDVIVRPRLTGWRR